MAFGAEIFGQMIRGKPDVPEFKPIDPATEQGKAITMNLAAEPQAEKLAAGVNQFNRDQINLMLEQSIPGFDQMKGDISSNIEAMLKGEIPSDVQDAIERSDAGKSLESGYGGTGMGRNLVARDLGLTSLNLIDKGITSAESWFKTMDAIEQPGMFNLASMFMTPGQVMAQDTEERNAQFQHDWAKNLIDWQSSLGYAAADDVQSTMAATQSMVLGMAGGMAGGACWVARSVYGETNPKWRQFREWLLNRAPKWFLRIYVKHGERFALWLDKNAMVKPIIKQWMDARIEGVK